MQIRENISLRPYHTFGIDVMAKFFATFQNHNELQELLSNQKSEIGNQKLILGGGSNILFTKDFDGLILKNELKGIEIIHEDEDYLFIKVGAGENWHQFVMYCVKNGYAGIENLALIPGNVGASPMQNIGAYGVEIKDVFESLEAFHVKEKSLTTFTLTDCAFGYRESVFKNKYRNQFVICSVTYRLNKKPSFNTSYGAIQQELEKMGVGELSIAAIAKAVINIRSSKLPDPAQFGNAGSFFKNPTISKQQFDILKTQYENIAGFETADGSMKVPAGWLIEQCGWKGYRKGDAGCYAKQALVLVNYSNASGGEIYNLSEEILQSVKKKFNITLEREVNVV